MMRDSARLGDHDVVERRGGRRRRRRRAACVRAASCARRSRRRRRAPIRATRSSSGSVISVRKPRLPKLTPRIGTSSPACAIRPAMPISVPSPPSTTTRSQAFGRSSRDCVGRPGRQADERGGVGLEHRLDAARLEPAGELGEHAGRGVEVVLGDEADAAIWAAFMRREACAGAAGTRVAFHAGDR